MVSEQKRKKAIDTLAELLLAAEEMVEAHDKDVYFDPSPAWEGEVERVERCQEAKERLRAAVAAIKGKG